MIVIIWKLELQLPVLFLGHCVVCSSLIYRFWLPLWYLQTLLPTKTVSSNPAHGEVYLNTRFCDKVCQWLVTGRWFSPGTLVSSTNKIDCHDIAEILLKVALNTITLILNVFCTKHTTRHINLRIFFMSVNITWWDQRKTL